MWSYHILEQLPKNFHVFKSLRYSRFKDTDKIELRSLLANLKTELTRQDKSVSLNSALLVKAPIDLGTGHSREDNHKPKRRTFCSNGKHNPLTTHSEADCHQLHPERTIAYYQSLLEKQGQGRSEVHRSHYLLTTLVPNMVILDSGASGHYLKDQELFSSYTECTKLLYAANASGIPVIEWGRAPLRLNNGDLNITKAFHAPSLSHSLIQLSTYLNLGYSLLPTPCGFECCKDNQTLFTGKIIENLLVLHLKTNQAITTLPNSMTLHQALGHPSQKYLEAAYPLLMLKKVDCASYDLSKTHQQSFSRMFPKPTTKLEVIHMNLCGPITPTSQGGNKYFLKIVDSHSKYQFLFTIKEKSQTFQAFLKFLNLAEMQSGKSDKFVVSENGGEFINKAF